MSSTKQVANAPEPVPPEAVSRQLTRTKRATSRDLLGDGDQLIIEHAGREYRLRLTQNGKLILTA